MSKKSKAKKVKASENLEKLDNTDLCQDTAEEQENTEKSAEPTLEEQLAKANDKYLRARADFENYRRRMAREFNEVRETAKSNAIREFLSVYDMFLLAVNHSDQSDDLESLKQGLKMIFNEFLKTYENLGVKQLETVGKDFDPNFHEAVSQQCSDTIPEGKIISEWKAGFLLNDKLLRAANVIVSAGKENEEN